MAPRTWYQRDIDQIVYSTVFRKLQRKSQLLPTRDPRRRTRLVHTLEVARISREISRQLGLDVTLTEAIALGHDLANSAYGAVGNKVLLMNTQNCGTPFRHEEAGARMVETISARAVPEALHERAAAAVKNHGATAVWSRDGLPFSLPLGEVDNDIYECAVTPEVLDGIRGHSGVWWPQTLEGQVVRFSDNFAYLSQDVDDLISTGILRRNDYEALTEAKLQFRGSTATVSEWNEAFPLVPLAGLFSGRGGARIGTLIGRFVEHNLGRLRAGDLDSKQSQILSRAIPTLTCDDGMQSAIDYIWSEVIEQKYEHPHIRRAAETQKLEIAQLFDLVKGDLSANKHVADFFKSLSSTRFADVAEDWKVAYLVAHLSWDEVTTTLNRVEERSSSFFIDIVGDATYPRVAHA